MKKLMFLIFFIPCLIKGIKEGMENLKGLITFVDQEGEKVLIEKGRLFFSKADLHSINSAHTLNFIFNIILSEIERFYWEKEEKLVKSILNNSANKIERAYLAKRYSCNFANIIAEKISGSIEEKIEKTLELLKQAQRLDIIELREGVEALLSRLLVSKDALSLLKKDHKEFFERFSPFHFRKKILDSFGNINSFYIPYNKGPIDSIFFDDNKLIILSEDGIVQLWDLYSKRLIYSFKVRDFLDDESFFSLHGRMLVIRNDIQKFQIWHVYRGECLFELTALDFDHFNIIFTRDEKYLIVYSNKNIADLSIKKQSGEIYNLSLKKNEAILFNIEEGIPQERFKHLLSLSSDAKVMAVEMKKGEVSILDIQSKIEISSLKIDNYIRTFFSPDNSKIAVVYSFKSQIFEVKNGRILLDLDTSDIDFSGDSKKVFDENLNVYDITSGTLLFNFTLDLISIDCKAGFIKEGELIELESLDKYKICKNAINFAKFSNDGSKLLIALESGEIQIFESNHNVKQYMFIALMNTYGDEFRLTSHLKQIYNSFDSDVQKNLKKRYSALNSFNMNKIIMGASIMALVTTGIIYWKFYKKSS